MKYLLWFFGALILAGIIWGLLFPSTSGHTNPGRAISGNDVYQLTTALKAYKTEYGVYPSGDEAGILKTLLGDNPRKIVFYETNPKNIDSTGRLLDPWKTPYRITFPDIGQQPKIWSAGKNKKDEVDPIGSDDICNWR